MGIGVVADPSDHETREVVHQAGRLHLKADAVLPNVSQNPIARMGVFDNYPTLSAIGREFPCVIYVGSSPGAKGLPTAPETAEGERGYNIQLGFDVRVLPDAMTP